MFSDSKREKTNYFQFFNFSQKIMQVPQKLLTLLCSSSTCIASSSHTEASEISHYIPPDFPVICQTFKDDNVISWPRPCAIKTVGLIRNMHCALVMDKVLITASRITTLDLTTSITWLLLPNVNYRTLCMTVNNIAIRAYSRRPAPNPIGPDSTQICWYRLLQQSPIPSGWY